jgi:preprotein translocase subunit SecF
MRLLKLVPDNTNIDFVRLRFVAFAVTTLLTIGALALVFVHGLNMGVDFEGGLMIEEHFETAPPLDELRSTIDALGVGDVSLQPFGDPKVISIRLPQPPGTDEGRTNAVVKKVEAAVAAKFPGATFAKYDTVSGKVSNELIQRGVIAVLIAILAIGLFAIFRFEWQFGISTVVAILHDVLMALGFFALTQLQFDLNIVAAVLTIIGYSINDKIVIDDRIRENMRRYRKMEMRDIVNLSVNETLPRTVMTSVTIILALGALLLFGGFVLRGFTSAMILGVIVGTYSSIYVSSSLLITLGLRAEPPPPRKTIADKAERIRPQSERR